jgi:hypothetical protein
MLAFCNAHVERVWVASMSATTMTSPSRYLTLTLVFIQSDRSNVSTVMYFCR